MEPAASRRAPLILVADRPGWLARSLESVLGPHGYTLLRAPSGARLLDRLNEVAPDAIIADFDLPDMDPPTLCAALRLSPKLSRAVPIVVIRNAPIPRRDRLAAVKAGAWLLLSMPVDAEELRLTIGNLVSAKLEADAAREETTIESATGLYNARGILRRVDELAADAVRYQRALSCVVLAATEPGSAPTSETKPEASDDTEPERLGHALRAGLRAADTLGRLGRTEFVVLAPDTGRRGAKVLANRLSAIAESVHPPDSGPRTIHVGAFAVDDLSAAHIEPTELLVRATVALRQTQTSQSSRIRFYEEPESASDV